jgi:hypothetical protein
MTKSEARAYASKIVDRLSDEGALGENEVVRQNNVRIVAEELLEIFGATEAEL